MAIIIDISHYPHVNFFKHAIRELEGKGIKINLVVQPRGNLTSIVEREIGLPFKSIGHYQKSLISKAFTLAMTDIAVFNYLRKTDVDLVVGVCGGISIAHSAFLLRKSSIIFEDDIEQKLVYNLYQPFVNRIVVPYHVPAKGKKVLKYRGFKELAYLHPNRFTPDENVLVELGVKANNYAFIREVSNTTTNYFHMKEGSLAQVCPELRRMGFNIVLSLENKTLKPYYEDYCTILEEPVSDIHSLMHYAAFTIASGDSMARESCLLGTPAIYTGGRVMSINGELERMGCLLPCEPDKQQILNLVQKILVGKLKERTTQVVGEAIESEWEDTTVVIVNNLLAILYKDDSLIEKYRRQL